MKLLKDKSGKWSSKRASGLACFIIGLSMAIASGFSWYNVDTYLVLSILSCGTVVLGAGVLEKK